MSTPVFDSDYLVQLQTKVSALRDKRRREVAAHSGDDHTRTFLWPYQPRNLQTVTIVAAHTIENRHVLIHKCAKP